MTQEKTTLRNTAPEQLIVPRYTVSPGNQTLSLPIKVNAGAQDEGNVTLPNKTQYKEEEQHEQKKSVNNTQSTKAYISNLTYGHREDALAILSADEKHIFVVGGKVSENEERRVAGQMLQRRLWEQEELEENELQRSLCNEETLSQNQKRLSTKHVKRKQGLQTTTTTNSLIRAIPPSWLSQFPLVEMYDILHHTWCETTPMITSKDTTCSTSNYQYNNMYSSLQIKWPIGSGIAILPDIKHFTRKEKSSSSNNNNNNNNNNNSNNNDNQDKVSIEVNANSCEHNVLAPGQVAFIGGWSGMKASRLSCMLIYQNTSEQRELSSQSDLETVAATKENKQKCLEGKCSLQNHNNTPCTKRNEEELLSQLPRVLHFASSPLPALCYHTCNFIRHSFYVFGGEVNAVMRDKTHNNVTCNTCSNALYQITHKELWRLYASMMKSNNISHNKEQIEQKEENEQQEREWEWICKEIIPRPFYTSAEINESNTNTEYDNINNVSECMKKNNVTDTTTTIINTNDSSSSNYTNIIRSITVQSPAPRASHCACVLQQRFLLIFGGRRIRSERDNNINNSSNNFSNNSNKGSYKVSSRNVNIRKEHRSSENNNNNSNNNINGNDGYNSESLELLSYSSEEKNKLEHISEWEEQQEYEDEWDREEDAMDEQIASVFASILEQEHYEEELLLEQEYKQGSVAIRKTSASHKLKKEQAGQVRNSMSGNIKNSVSNNKNLSLSMSNKANNKKLNTKNKSTTTSRNVKGKNMRSNLKGKEQITNNNIDDDDDEGDEEYENELVKDGAGCVLPRFALYNDVALFDTFSQQWLEVRVNANRESDIPVKRYGAAMNVIPLCSLSQQVLQQRCNTHNNNNNNNSNNNNNNNNSNNEEYKWNSSFYENQLHTLLDKAPNHTMPQTMFFDNANSHYKENIMNDVIWGAEVVMHGGVDERGQILNDAWVLQVLNQPLCSNNHHNNNNNNNNNNKGNTHKLTNVPSLSSRELQESQNIEKNMEQSLPQQRTESPLPQRPPSVTVQWIRLSAVNMSNSSPSSLQNNNNNKQEDALIKGQQHKQEENASELICLPARAHHSLVVTTQREVYLIGGTSTPSHARQVNNNNCNNNCTQDGKGELCHFTIAPRAHVVKSAKANNPRLSTDKSQKKSSIDNDNSSSSNNNDNKKKNNINTANATADNSNKITRK